MYTLDSAVSCLLGRRGACWRAGEYESAFRDERARATAQHLSPMDVLNLARTATSIPGGYISTATLLNHEPEGALVHNVARSLFNRELAAPKPAAKESEPERPQTLAEIGASIARGHGRVEDGFTDEQIETINHAADYFGSLSRQNRR